RLEPHDRTTRYDQGPVAAPSRRFSFCLSSRARDHIPVLIPHRLRVLGPERGKVLYSITKHAMRRSADEIGATSISFRPKVFSDPASVLTEFFPPIEFARQESNRAHGSLERAHARPRGNDERTTGTAACISASASPNAASSDAANPNCACKPDDLHS